LIKKPKKLSFSYCTSLLSLIFLPLIGLFTYTAIFKPEYFVIISAVQLLIILYLFILQKKLLRKQAFHNLEKENYREKINLLGVEIENETNAVSSFKEKIESYSQLKILTEKLSMCLSLNDTSDTISKEVNKFFKHKDITVIIYIFHSKTGELGISSSQKGQMRINIKSKKGDVFDQYVIKTMQSLLIEDTKRDFRFDFDKIDKGDSRTILSLISVPLVIGSKTLGILRVDSPMENHFKTEDLRLLKTIGDIGAIAIENAQLYETVEDLAIRDSLTGLYLRRYLLERMTQEISRVLRRDKELSFLMIDLDMFKKYNDKFGHTAGDIVLRTVGLTLSDCFKDPGNLVSRYGGEEFAVLLPDCPKKDAIKIAEEIRKKIESQIIILRRQKTNITVSIGVATFPEDTQIKEELIGKADEALYAAKAKGRNRVCSI